MDVEPVKDRDEPLSPLTPPASFLLGPSWLSSPPSRTPLVLLVSGPSSAPLPPPSSLFPLTDEESECRIEGEEEGREERGTGWKPCWREERHRDQRGWGDDDYDDAALKGFATDKNQSEYMREAESSCLDMTSSI